MTDEREFSALYERTREDLWRYLRGLSGDAQTADDLLQETYLRFLQADTEKLRDERELRSYLFRIATNLTRDHWRKKKRGEAWEEETAPQVNAIESESPERSLHLRLDMKSLFEHLSARQRALMWLAYVECATHQEIATALNIGERSVKVLLHRTKQRLLKLIQSVDEVDTNSRSVQ